jgi:hypothetical protein
LQLLLVSADAVGELIGDRLQRTANQNRSRDCGERELEKWRAAGVPGAPP